jgi:heme-degrading monooxygenase HmoA
MHARLSTLQLDPSRIDDAIRGLEERDVGELEKQEGFKGLTLLVDRQSGKAVGVSFWESEDAMRNSEETGEATRARAAEAGGGAAEAQGERFEGAIDTLA